MRITHYLHHLWSNEGGVYRAVLNLCREQARAGLDVTLASCDPRDVPAAWRSGGPGLPRVHPLPALGAGRALFDPRAAGAFASMVGGLDVLHLHNVWDPMHVPMSRAAREAGKPYVLSAHGMLADWSLAQKRWKKMVSMRVFADRVLSHAAGMHLTAQGELDQSAKRHPKTPGCVVPLMLDLEPYRDAPDSAAARRELELPPPGEPAILYLSRLHDKKRPDLVIRSVADLRRQGTKAWAVLAGPGDDPYRAWLQRVALEAGVGEHVRFLGMVPEPLKPSLFAACDLFVLPTHMENFGFVYFESLACGTPLVTTRGTDTWKELESSGAAVIVNNPATVVELSGAIARLLSDREALRARGHAGRAWVLSNMAPERIVGGYVRMYESVVRGGRP